jgi:hypothetical protein
MSSQDLTRESDEGFAPVERTVGAMTAEEFEALPDSEKEKYPALEVMSFAGRIFGEEMPEAVFVLVIEEMLIELRYYFQLPIGKMNLNLKRAIRDFQIDQGESPTGVLTMAQFMKLGDLGTSQEIETILPGSSPLAWIGDTVATAEGTWSFEGNARPIQSCQIRCFRDFGLCFEALGQINYDPIFGNDAMLDISLELWDITRWSSEEVVAEKGDSKCVSYTLTINGQKGKALQFRRGKGGPGCEGIAESPQIIEMVNGVEVALDYYRERRNAARENMSSEFRKHIESLATSIKQEAD